VREARFGRNVHSLPEVAQQQLGDATRLDRSFIGSIGRGKRNISADTIDRPAEALDVNAADLLALKATHVARQV
jgi:transcriptional regulator with XRE-family HTH domain